MTLGETSSPHAEKYASVITVKKMNNIITQPPLSASELMLAHTPCVQSATTTGSSATEQNYCQCDRTVVLSHETSLAHRSRPVIWAQNLRSGKMSRRERWG